MDTETLTKNQRSDIAEWTKQTRKISTTARQQPNKVARKISHVMSSTDAFKEGLQVRLSNERPGRKISLNWANLTAEDKFGKAQKLQPKMENTYQLEPEQTFPYCAVQTVMLETLQRHLEGTKYDQNESSYKAKIICEDIKSKVKAMNVGRYRIVCLVHIGSNKGQEIKIASRSLWNPHVDTFASADFKSKDLFAVATVYGVYFE